MFIHPDLLLDHADDRQAQLAAQAVSARMARVRARPRTAHGRARPARRWVFGRRPLLERAPPVQL